MNLISEDKNKILEFINLANKNSDFELEVILNPQTFLTYKQNINSNLIDSVKFNKCYTRLVYLYGSSFEDKPRLDIITDENTFRVTIEGKENIIEYYKTDKINFEKVSVISKSDIKLNSKNVKNIDILEFSLRVKLRNETEISDKRDIKKIVDQISDQNKYFRYKKRYSFLTSDNLFRFDLTIVKVPKNSHNKKYKRISDSNILKEDEKYEIEIEYIGNKNKDISDNVEDLYDKLIKYITQVWQVLNNSSFVISLKEKSLILNNYVQVVDPSINISSLDFSSRYFIGPKVVSMSVNNILKSDVVESKIKNIVSIRNKYTVTEKSDGERCLIFINNNKQIYLINDRLDVKYTGIRVKSFTNCILDGEHITKTKKGDNINHILIFDIYFKNGKDLRSKFFKVTTQEFNSNNEVGRFDQIKEIFSSKEISENNINQFQFIVKEFKLGGFENDKIFDISKDVWNKALSQDYPYNVDGLIYTPLIPITDILSNSKNTTPFYSGVTWNKLIKWKPQTDNTIDFLVKIVKDNNKDKISYLVVDGEVKKYKTLILYTGYSPDKNEVYEPCDLIFKSNSSKKQNLKSSYYAKEFQPYGKNEYIANIFLEVKNGKEILSTEKGGEILDNMVIEMYYDMTREQNWKWIARNIRYDKTEKAKDHNSNVFGNDYNTALSIWDSYYFPITEDILFGEEGIPENYTNSDVYYTIIDSSFDRKNSLTIQLRRFHNSIKDLLIKSSCSMIKDAVVLDLGCGQGGDLQKFRHSQISKYLGIDLFNNNLLEACKRYCLLKKNVVNLYDGFFINGDISKNILNGDFINNSFECYKHLFNYLFGIKNNYQSDDNVLDTKYNIFNKGFDIINIQFAIHYLFENKVTLDNLIININQNIKNGGLFIGTCYDGKLVFEFLKDINKDEYKIGYNNYEKKYPIWRIKKEYDNDRYLSDNDKSLGIKISVIMDSIKTENVEYLVNFDYLTERLNNIGLYLLNEEECLNYEMPMGENKTSTGLFENSYEKNLFQDSNNILSNDEKTISFLNRWFIFKKRDLVITNDKIKISKKKK